MKTPTLAGAPLGRRMSLPAAVPATFAPGFSKYKPATVNQPSSAFSSASRSARYLAISARYVEGPDADGTAGCAAASLTTAPAITNAPRRTRDAGRIALLYAKLSALSVQLLAFSIQHSAVSSQLPVSSCFKSWRLRTGNWRLGIWD